LSDVLSIVSQYVKKAECVRTTDRDGEREVLYKPLWAKQSTRRTCYPREHVT